MDRTITRPNIEVTPCIHAALVRRKLEYCRVGGFCRPEWWSDELTSEGEFLLEFIARNWNKIQKKRKELRGGHS